MRYLSTFSGIGGLEASEPPELFCEIDPVAAEVLRAQHPAIPIWDDITSLQPPRVDVVAGGWPCQDISIAGHQLGLDGLRSRLLFELLRVAVEGGAHTVVAENVTNLLRMRNGAEFEASLKAFVDNGFDNVAWRVLNARQFGLPQHRSRLLIIASRDRSIATSLFRTVSPTRPLIADSGQAAGFYWTAGTHSINYSVGYVPTIKIGSSLGIASPPAVHYADVVRMLGPTEALALQGFDLSCDDFPNRTAAYKAAGNAVARDIGRWVLDGVVDPHDVCEPELIPRQESMFDGLLPEGRIPTAGLLSSGVAAAVRDVQEPLARNLDDFLDLSSSDRLSTRASAGLLKRLRASGTACPADLLATLAEHASSATPSKAAT